MDRYQQIDCLRYVCERHLVDFIRYTFRNRDGSRFIAGPVQRVVCETLERVYEGTIKRLIINIAPGYTKTETAVRGLIAWSLARNPRCRFLHISYGDSVALDNSAAVKEVIESDYYQRLWPMQLKQDAQSKHRWFNTSGGGMHAAGSGSAVTGFRAGRDMYGTEFSGAAIIDDALKPEDANSRIKRESINARFTHTIRSRLVNEDTPIIVIGQRVHQHDLPGVLLRGGLGEQNAEADRWHHLCIPAVVSSGAEYPAEYTHGIPIDHKLPPGPAWPDRHSAAQLAAIEAADRHVYAAQYLQAPRLPGGSMFDISCFRYYDKYDAKRGTVSVDGRDVPIRRISLFADTAHKRTTYADYTAMAVWGKGSDGCIYLLDLLHDKLESAALRSAFFSLLERWRMRPGETVIGLRDANVEDKASGIGLIQEAQNVIRNIQINAVGRNRDKVSRAYDTVPSLEDGRLVLPVEAPWLRDFLSEHEDFSPAMTHSHDDMVDTTMDAVQILLGSDTTLDYGRML